MRVSDENGTVTPKTVPPLWDTLRRIQVTIGADSNLMADLMRLTVKEFGLLKRQRREPSVSSTMALTQVLNVGFEALVKNSIDYTTLAKQFQGDEQYVPEKYMVGAASRRRTVTNLLNYIESHFGWEKRVQILRNHQMTEAMFANPDEWINLKFSVDISSWIYKHYADENILFDMGKNAAHTHRNSPIGLTLGKTRNLRELFEMMFNGVLERFVENNFIWQIRSLTPEQIVIRGTPKSDAIALIGANYINNHHGCLIRKGFIASIPTYLNYPQAQVTKNACVSCGDGYCEFVVELRSITSQGSKPRFRLC